MHRFRVVCLALATTSLLPLPAAANCPLGRFAAPPSYVHGDLLTVADFNRDGRLDTVTAFPAVSAIHVNLGGPGGTFEHGPAIEIVSQTERLEVAFAATTADVDGDGNLDLVLAAQSSGAIEVHRGRGDGTFHPREVVSYQAMPRSVAAGDFDGDGVLDLAAADPLARRIDVYWGLGAGKFVTPPTMLQIDTGRPNQLATADFNGDGRDDFFFGVTETGLEVRLATPGRTFAQPHQLEMTGGYYGSVIRDVDGDGEIDLTVADLVVDVISIFRGRGDGTFEARTDYRAGLLTEGVAFGELTGDGIPDIVSANAIGAIVVLPGFGSGKFGAPVSYDAGYNPYGVIVADFNGDGLDDVLTTDRSSYSVLLQRDDRRLPQVDAGEARSISFDIATSDFNSDGIPDVAVNAYERAAAVIFLGNGDGTLREGSLAALGAEPVLLDVADLNADGRSDLVAGLRGGISVALGKGNGQFQAPELTPLDNIIYLSGTGDFDNDGDVDAMALDRVANTILFLANDGKGHLTDSRRDVRIGRIPTSAMLVDVNGDAKNDLVTTEDPVINNFAELGFLVIRLGNGNGTFGSPRELPAGNTPAFVAASDFNNDGRLDLAVSDFTPAGGLHLYRGTGSGAFREAAVLPGHHQTGKPELRDFDADGDVDVAFATTGLVLVYENLGVETLGNFTFAAEPLAHLAGPQPRSVGSADFNGDGRLDLVTGGVDGHVSIQLNGTACRRRSARR